MKTIRYVTPYALDKNLGAAYNREMKLGGADYIAFCDGDTEFLDSKYGHHISEIVNEHPLSYFTCQTNRTNCDWQRNTKILPDADHVNDIATHVSIAQTLKKGYKNLVQDHTKSSLWSGHLMICPVELWQPITKTGLLGIDNEIHKMAQDQGAKVLLMKGIYIYHWYSNFDGSGGNQQRDKSHLF